MLKHSNKNVISKNNADDRENSPVLEKVLEAKGIRLFTSMFHA